MFHITPSSVIVQQDDDGLTAKDLQALDLLENDFDACFEYLTQPDPVCPSPAPQSPGASLAAPAEAVQGVVTHQRISEIRAAWAADRAASWASFRATWPMHVVELFRVVGFGFLVGLVLAFALVVWLLERIA